MSESLETQLRSLTLNDELQSTYDDIVKACPKYANWLVDTTNLDKPPQISHTLDWKSAYPQRT